MMSSHVKYSPGMEALRSRCCVAPLLTVALVATFPSTSYTQLLRSLWSSGEAYQHVGDSHQFSASAKAMPGAWVRGPGGSSEQRSKVMRSLGSEQQSTVIGSTVVTKEEEVKALLALKQSIIDPQGRMDHWSVPDKKEAQNNPLFYCSWSGISCNTSTGSVTDINFSVFTPSRCFLANMSSKAQGIPPELGALTALRTLDLGNLGICQPQVESGDTASPKIIGGLTGTIPSELGQCTALTFLSLSANQLQGTVPETLSSLTNLAVLLLGSNNLCCSIPAFISTFTLLNTLSLTPNNFSGSIPNGISALTGLSRLELFSSPISGTLPSGIGNLVSLTYSLVLKSLSITGSLPKSLSRLTGLQSLEVYDVPIEGSLPRWLSSMSSLTKLELTATKLNGTLPSTFFGGPSLSYLRITDNSISGPIPPSLISQLCSTAKSFGTLNLANNSLSGNFPTELSKCTSLNTLDFSNNSISGPFPPDRFFQSLSSTLYTFKVGQNGLNGSVPQRLLSMLPLLTIFDVSNNRLSGPSPFVDCTATPGLGQFRIGSNAFTGTLASVLPQSCSSNQGLILDLSDNRLTGSIPGYLKQFTTLQELQLQGNRLQGQLVVPWSSPSLLLLNASFNNLTGTIPQRLMHTAPLLEVLDLSYNQLAGTIPVPVIGSNTSSTTLGALVLSGNKLNGSIPVLLSLMKQLLTLDLSSNSLTGSLPSELASIEHIRTLNASANSLSGPIPSDLFRLSYLSSLSLSSNNFSGPIPPQLAPPNLPRLTYLNLSHNRLTGGIPPGFYLSGPGSVEDLSFNNLSGAIPVNQLGSTAFTEEEVQGNQGLCGGAGYSECPEADAGSATLSTGQVVGIAIGGAAVVSIIVATAFFFMRTKDEWSGGTMLVFKHSMGGLAEEEKALSIKMLLKVTNRFSEEYLLGRGGFGEVYRATLPDGTDVAVKRLAKGSSQGESEFKAEVRILGGLTHKNLVPIVGAFVGAPPENERLLIYVFLSGGSLDQVMLSELPNGNPLRSWKIRKSIALDVARGLKYLHHDCSPGIVHRDMKPANVLLDESWNAYVADFGLATQFESTKGHMTSEVTGTIGFLAPEYTAFGHMSFKSDVYAYGITLIRMITGRQPQDDEVFELGMDRWLRMNVMSSLVDPNMDLEPEEKDEVLGAVLLGLLCISRLPVDRPSMLDVVTILENPSALAACAKQRGAEHTQSA